MMLPEAIKPRTRAVLKLEGYLERDTGPTYEHSTTFTRILPKTPELPAVTVGLGVVFYSSYSNYGPRVEGIPHYLTPMKEDGFVAVVLERQRQYFEYSHLGNWQERLLMDLGYVFKLPMMRSRLHRVQEGVTTFSMVPKRERAFLLEKYGFQKVALMVAHGHASDIDTVLTSFEEMRGNMTYHEFFRMMEFGVPVEDLPLTAQLPIEMVEELYSANSGRAVRRR